MKPLIASVSALLVFGGLLVSASAVSARPAAEDFYSYKVDQATVEQVTDGDTRESFAVQIREAGVYRVEMVDPGGVKWTTSGHGHWYEPEYAYVKVTDTRLTGATLASADLSFMYLRVTDFSGANLEGADFSESILNSVSYSGANLRMANMFAAHGLDVDFTGADLSGANLFGTDHSTWVFTGAKADTSTIWPDGFNPEAAGVVFRDS